jgi:hypothetical protein
MKSNYLRVKGYYQDTNRVEFSVVRSESPKAHGRRKSLSGNDGQEVTLTIEFDSSPADYEADLEGSWATGIPHWLDGEEKVHSFLEAYRRKVDADKHGKYVTKTLNEIDKFSVGYSSKEYELISTSEHVRNGFKSMVIDYLKPSRVKTLRYREIQNSVKLIVETVCLEKGLLITKAQLIKFICLRYGKADGWKGFRSEEYIRKKQPELMEWLEGQVSRLELGQRPIFNFRSI